MRQGKDTQMHRNGNEIEMRMFESQNTIEQLVRCKFQTSLLTI